MSPYYARTRWLLHFAVLLLVCVISNTVFSAGVPDVPLDYELSVEAWWQKHPMNPARAEGAHVVTSPEPVVDVAPGGPSLQSAIDALPASGGTLRLAEGTYPGGFEILRRSHVHLVGTGKVVISGGVNFVIGDKLNHDYGAFCAAAVKKKPDAMQSLRELPTSDVYFKNITFEKSTVRLASCKAVLFDDCTFHQPPNRDEGAADAEGKKILRWYRPLPVTGIMGLQGIWFRGCEFAGDHANAYYLDGVQGSGAINCTFAGVDHLWRNAILLFTNDDCSLDVTDDDKLEPWERRDVRYYVVDGCRFGSGYERGAIAVSGRDILAQNGTYKKDGSRPRRLRKPQAASAKNCGAEPMWTGSSGMEPARAGRVEARTSPRIINTAIAAVRRSESMRRMRQLLSWRNGSTADKPRPDNAPKALSTLDFGIGCHWLRQCFCLLVGHKPSTGIASATSNPS